MRINYYRFPDKTPDDVLLSHGCSVFLKDGTEVFPKQISEEDRPLIDYVNPVVSCLSVSEVKELMRQYGGSGITEHIDRDGCVFEITPIQLQGNNSRFKYNRHL